MDELMTIGTFAERTGLSVSALRFYAAQHVLEPAAVDPTNGYRQYADRQVADGRLVRDLRSLGMPLADISTALTRADPERIELIERHLRRLESMVENAHDVARSLGVDDHSKEQPMTTTSLPANHLAESLGQVLPAAGRDPDLPHLMTVLVEHKDGSVRFVATDRRRLAVRDVVPTESGDDFSVVVSASTAANWHGQLRGSEQVALGLGGTALEARQGGTTLRAPALPIEFPGYERFLEPVPNLSSVRIDRAALLAMVEALEGALVARLTDGRLTLEYSAGVEPVEATGAGIDRRVVLDAAYLTDALRHAVGPEVVIDLDEPQQPVVVRSADDGTFTTRIMPIVR